MPIELDEIDKLAAKGFEGVTVRKDLIRTFKGQYPVPTYVAEFLLGRYCSLIDESEIRDGLQIVERQLSERTVRAGEQELFKARAREKGSIKLIDLISVRLDSDDDEFVATLPSLQLRDVRIGSDLVQQHERMLTGGFYAEIELTYDPIIAQESSGRAFGVASLREIQVSMRDVLATLYRGREMFDFEQWKVFLLRSIGIEGEKLSPRSRDVMLLRMLPLVERNYNAVELGPRGTGKSHLFQQVSPYSHLISGGKATVAKMFVNNSNGQRGLVCMYDAICFDEVSGVSFDQKDGVNIMKGYMESGEFSRGRESIRAEGSIVMVGNFDVDVQHQQKVGHLFGPLPPEMRDDTAFMDRIHAYIPGWDLPKVSKEILTDHLGLVSDFLSECWNQLRKQSRQAVVQGRVHFGGALSGRDTGACLRTISGLIKLMYPNPTTPVPDEALEWAVKLALESRRRVKEQQKRIGSIEFRNTHFSYILGDSGVETFVSTPELASEEGIGADPLPPGQIYVLSPGADQENPGLYKIDVTIGPGGSVRIVNTPTPAPFREAVRCAEQNLLSHARKLVGDRNPRQYDFTVQLLALDSSKSGSNTGVGALIALCSALLQKSLKGGLIVAGNINLGGSIEPLYNPVNIAELAIEKGATTLLVPVSARKQMIDLPDTQATKINVTFYSDAQDALVKALFE